MMIEIIDRNGNDISKVVNNLMDRERVREALLHACGNEGVICDDPLIIERDIDDEFIDRLVEGLSR